MNQVNYTVLNKLIEERAIKRIAIAQTIGVTEQTLRNKLQGRSKFDIDEATMIQERYFPDITVTELFRPAV